jgi:hypothetical protein
LEELCDPSLKNIYFIQTNAFEEFVEKEKQFVDAFSKIPEIFGVESWGVKLDTKLPTNISSGDSFNPYLKLKCNNLNQKNYTEIWSMRENLNKIKDLINIQI